MDFRYAPFFPIADTEALKIQRVVCAAIRIDVHRMICSPRHSDKTFHDIVNMLPEDVRDEWHHGEQGFVDQFGNFLTRGEAWVVALRQNQIIRDHDVCRGTLYSEHLY